MWVLVALASLAVLALLVLCVPLDLSCEVSVDGRAKVDARMTWLFGLVKTDLARAREKKREAAAKKRAVKRRFSFQDFKTMVRVLRTKGLFRQVKRLVTDLLRSIRIRRLEADLTVGLGDPAATGLLFAVAGPLTLLPPLRGRMRLRPSLLGGPQVQGYGVADARVVPVRLVVPLARFTFSRPAWTVARTMLTAKWRKG